MGIQSVWTEDQYAKENEAWVRQRFEFIKTITEGSYVNFPINHLSNYDKEYFGGNAQRLHQVKKV
ncbi:FAD-binding oxidoreductase OS=Lysinibacillus sphaericus OX=1421 GN=LS41612_13930 PE=3 SV=1 [Lysinibacillus sphaericus]